jgi:type I restriction enzyme S subunit
MYRKKSLLVQLNLLFSDLNQRLGSLKFKDAFDLSGGYAFKSSEYKDTGSFVLRVTNISEDGTIDKKDAKFITPLNNEDYKDYNLRFGDVLIVMIGGSIGKVGLVDQESLPAFLNQNMWLVRSSKHYSPKYIFYLCLYLCHYHATEKNTSYGFYSRKHFKELAVPNVSSQDSFAIGSILDNIANQKTIEFSNLFSRQSIQNIISIQVNSTTISSLKAELHNQEKYVSQLKQAILQEAIAGQLTAEWRTQNSMQKGNPDTDAAALLAKIKAEKQQLIAEGKLKKEKPLPEIAIDEIPFSLPDSWVWCRLGENCTKIGSGSTPRGSDYSEIGIPFFRSQNIHNNGLVFKDIKYISSEMHKKMNGTAILSGDLLLNITGGSLGRCALLPENINDGNVSQHVCIIRPLLSNNTFFHFLILSPFFQTLVFKQTTGAGREGLPKYNMERFLIPLPPLGEQKAIAEKVDRLMNIIDQLEQQIKHRKQLAEDLMQTVLREAFE